MQLLARLVRRLKNPLKPRTSRPAAAPAFVSPEVSPDRRVTFRLHAPGARSVWVEGIPGGPSLIRMVRGSQGVWSLTAGPLEAGIYSYAYIVDGTAFPDPRNRRIQDWIWPRSQYEVPNDPPAFWQSTDVPRGTLHRHTYRSNPTGAEVGIQIYTPPGYDDDPDRSWPGLYLLHGFGDNEQAWQHSGRANTIADNAIAAGKAAPCVIVMPYGHPVPSTGKPSDSYFESNAIAMETALTEEIIPFSEKHYRLASRRENRAIAGLSMGGGQALRAGLHRPDLFGSIAAFSAKTPVGNLDAIFPNPDSRERRLLWMGCGRNDPLFAANETFVAWLNSRNIPSTWKPTPGWHAWNVWRRYLYEVLPLLSS